MPDRQQDRRPFSYLHSQDRARRLRLDSGPLQQIEQLGLPAIRRRDSGTGDPNENANYLRPMPAAQSEEFMPLSCSNCRFIVFSMETFK